MKKLLLLLLCMACMTFADEFEEDIALMLHMTNSLSSAQLIATQMGKSMRQINPNIPQEFLNKLVSELTNKKLIETVTPIYKKHFTHADIKALIAFYNSDIGKKLARKTPLITQESMLAGQKMGMELAQEIMQSLQKSGYNMGI